MTTLRRVVIGSNTPPKYDDPPPILDPDGNPTEGNRDTWAEGAWTLSVSLDRACQGFETLPWPHPHFLTRSNPIR